MSSWLHAETSEHCKFIELLAFAERAPVVYLRRFDYENPNLPTLTRPRCLKWVMIDGQSE